MLDRICLQEPKHCLSLRLRANRHTRFVGEASPHLRERVKLGGQVWYSVKVLHIRHDLFAGTETLSLSVY